MLSYSARFWKQAIFIYIVCEIDIQRMRSETHSREKLRGFWLLRFLK